jgi:anti-anti-sigma factor
MSSLAVEGELSIYRASELKAALLDAVASGDALELDLSKVTEMDSAGLQLVLLAAREAKAAGKCFGIAARSPQVDEVLQLCGLEGNSA